MVYGVNWCVGQNLKPSLFFLQAKPVIYFPNLATFSCMYLYRFIIKSTASFILLLVSNLDRFHFYSFILLLMLILPLNTYVPHQTKEVG